MKRPRFDAAWVSRTGGLTTTCHLTVQQTPLPITQRLILQAHATLLTGVRGEQKMPGEFRRTPVWVGRAGVTPENAIFVPPLPKYLGELLTDWERFINEDDKRLPPLIQAALMHYQFETIHPFLDDNSRIGRLLINLLLIERKRPPLPLLYLSNYFETHRDEYYDRLQAVRERAEIDQWFTFFLQAVRAQADDAVHRSRRLVAIREAYHREAIKERSNLPRLVDIIVKNPFVTVKSIESQPKITNQGARNLIKTPNPVAGLAVSARTVAGVVNAGWRLRSSRSSKRR